VANSYSCCCCKFSEDEDPKGQQETEQANPAVENNSDKSLGSKEDPADDAAEAREQVTDEMQPNNLCFRKYLLVYFTEYHFPFLSIEFKGCRVVAWSFVLIFLALIPPMTIESLSMEAPQGQEGWYREGHMFNEMENYLSDQFLTGSDYAYVTVHVGFGVEGLSRSGVNYYDSGDFLGTVQYSDTFDITTEAAQNSTLQACQIVRDYACSAEGCSGGSGKLAVPGLVVCWIDSFLAYYRNSTGSSGYPTGSTFNTYYDLWAAESQYGEWSELTGKVDGKVGFFLIKFTSTLKANADGLYDDVFKVCQSLVTDLAAQAASSILPVMYSGGGNEAWQASNEALVDGFYVGIFVAFPCALVVLLFATRNILLSFYAVVSIVGIVVMVLSFVSYIMGYDLGVTETITAIMAIGFSVDYTVHLGTIYAYSKAESCVDKAQEANRVMGMTILSGAGTTFAAGIILQACQMTFFVKMSVLICITVVSSLVFSLVYFLCVLIVAGPTGNWCSINPLFSCLPSICSKDQEKSDP